MPAIHRLNLAQPINPKILTWLLLVFLCVGSIGVSKGLTISPTVLEMSATSGRSAQIRLENHNTFSIPIEASLRQLVFSHDGSYDAVEAEDSELMVFPPATVLPAGGIQIFRIQWLGSDTLPSSQSFFVRFTQPPIQGDMSDAPSGVAIEIHYNALVHLSSRTQSARLSLEVSDNGVARLSNSGNRYTFLSRMRFIKDTNVGIDKPDQIFGEHFIPPFSTIELTTPNEIQSGLYDGEAR
ncbi:fimbrial biogenesis chaperone [Enterovibrio calviensis]|uniref:fimbrial biogenesis chaperone n=1 Tax=Enterovibrio calviensis TaxID=91359 RepID=UPI000B14B128|nr:fimbria/pilus periplasmic chaperone [Enterovibrio calviensis]